VSELRLGRVPLLAAAGALLAFIPPTGAGAAPKLHRIVIDKMKFGPLPAGIRSGDTILWENRDLFRHTATARDKSFNVDLPPKTSGRTVIRHAGPIAFYCVYHPGMKGTLEVSK
jgi:plastocyanin